MSYQVLARKWRPRTFRELVGQQHVLQALVNALDHDRLHHAYLFTGTRGVGKTTIARILAKCLNCETGVSSEPCGQCSACREINDGRFVDLIEVDAASRTKVEDTRELLENVQYAPTRGRYKVYLIDEVHMLSSHSFNALLKTLEEPPPHVKFLLATTDPQKLPVTILSRCLQFHLKNMEPERIVGHLQQVLEQEMVPFEEAALWQLGRAADGSMRDAMSLTDQAIAFGGGKVVEADVRAMLGTIDQNLVFTVLQALVSADSRQILTSVEQLSQHAPDYGAALAELLSTLHRVAIAQALPEAVDNARGDREQILALAGQLPAEDVQLFYQTALMGRRDLPLSPEPRAGFEMVLLRMLAFRPQGVHSVPTDALPQPAAPQQAQPDSTAVQPVAPVAAPLAETAPVAAIPETQQPTPEQPQPAAAQPEPPAPRAGAQMVPQPPAPYGGELAPAAPPEDLPWDDEPEAGFAAEPQVSAPEPVQAPAPQFQAPQPQSPQPSQTRPPQPQPPQARPEPGLQPAAAVPPPPVREEEPMNLAPLASDPVDPRLQSEGARSLQSDELAAMGLTSARSLPTPKPKAPAAISKVPFAEFTPERWIEVYAGLGVTGLLQSTVANCVLEGGDGDTLHFLLDQAQSTLYDQGHQQRMAELLSNYFQRPLQVVIRPGVVEVETPAAFAIRLKQEQYKGALQALYDDPLVQQLLQQFEGTLDEESVEAVQHNSH
ncbi:DNA polymerase III subunit gamma/tau [Pseudomaricurvus sp. HS19]|uniref:DNA polymerase III subunit gamma/tau n=1 Tax=Pseudomaricurvus sp. HS19 TaxID=2692626 RepID=UPI00136FC65F|nr:DNA polymerase III subunit gamma/tau [Pseudomaricurvus sp. HS19]MYM62785.1 DNA polymerase III subunit gamma/tau [Pseudomaricurvus sp. HS19]